MIDEINSTGLLSLVSRVLVAEEGTIKMVFILVQLIDTPRLALSKKGVYSA